VFNHPLRFYLIFPSSHCSLHKSKRLWAPNKISTSDNTTIKVTQLPKLASDGKNWLTYYERVLNAATARGLHCHLIGTALKPSTVIKKEGKFYLPDDSDPLSDEALEKHEISADS
jgi:hypothetical protein